MTIKWSKHFYAKSDCENVFGLKMTIKSPLPPPPKLPLGDIFLERPLEEKHHAFWYHTDEKNPKIKTS
jgi:hypothetical protein